MAAATSKLPVEVELMFDVMPCQAMRRSYDGAEDAHACSHFAEWGLLHSYDYADDGPPARPGVVQPARYAGKRHVVPEILSGCRKAPILAVGINPNLPGWREGDRNAIHPYFDDYLQYAHYFRWRALDKLDIPKAAYDRLLDGRDDDTPQSGRPLTGVGGPIEVTPAPVTMYRQYQTLLDGLAESMGWSDHNLAVGEDIAYANMVACGSARWTTSLRPGEQDMPLMGEGRARAIVDECFNKRAHFPRQLLQSLPAVVIVFSNTTADAFISRLGRHFTKGDPVVGEGVNSLLGREIRMRLGRTREGEEIDARVIFSPHASANPAQFGEQRERIIAHLREEVERGNLTLNAQTGHLARRRGECRFCDNSLYKIGDCAYRAELEPLVDPSAMQPLDDAGSADAPDREEHLRLLSDFMSADRPEGDEPELVPLDAAAPSAPRMALRGRVVTMKDGAVLPDGCVYTHAGTIVAVQPSAAAPPPGFETVARVETGGVIFPGLADLHNHLAYNILSLWAPNQALVNRSQWLRNTDYRSKVGQVMDVVAKQESLRQALVRYVEAKLLLGGVTSGQGMVTKYGGRSDFRGIVRNFEQSDDPDLTNIRHKITDLKTTEIADVRAVIQSGARYFFHLAEGTNDAANAQFRMLVENDLLAPNLVGIHSLGLTAADLTSLGAAGASVVWSPFSNSILYGRTLNVADLKASGAKFALGSDWTPSGSRNPLCEMKIASLTAEAQGHPLSAEELTRAVTCDALDMAGWGDRLGTLEAGKFADIVVVRDRQEADPYGSLLNATEADIRLVVVAGHPRSGDADLMRGFYPDAADLESVAVGGGEKLIKLSHPASPLNGLSLEAATRRLTAALSDLHAARDAAAFETLDAGEGTDIELPLDELEADMADEFEILADPVLPDSVPLDPLTLIDDADFWGRLDAIGHLPDALKGATGLRRFYAP